MPSPDTPVQKSVMGSAINKPSKAVIFELDSMMTTSDSSLHARGNTLHPTRDTVAVRVHPRMREEYSLPGSS